MNQEEFYRKWDQIGDARCDAIRDCIKIVEEFGEFDGPASVKMLRSMCATAIVEKLRELLCSEGGSQ